MAEEQSDVTQLSRQKSEDYGSLQPGALIGRYEIVSVLGQGGFGITYRARDVQLERDVAIKEYLPSSLAVRHEGTTVLPRSTQMADAFLWGRARFLDEAKTMARLAHAPAIVRVHDFLEANGTAYVVMPLLEGETLEARLKRETRLQQPAIERILYPLLDGLEQVHGAGFLHRDIKPANIILDGSGAPTLIDFGAARASLEGRSQAMTAVFTPGYAPLEQFVSGKQGPWTDIYALAATLYACIAGKPPPNAMERMAGEAIVPAAEVGKRRYAPSLLAAIDAGLGVKADSRPQSIDEWRDVLATGVLARLADPMADDGATQRSAPPPAPAVAPEPSVSASLSPAKITSRLPLLAGIAGVVLVLAVGGYFVLAPGGKPAPSGAALQDLRVEDLERVLAERRAADAAAVDKKRLEEEAQHKAETEAGAKRAADTDLADAQKKRQKAEEELAKLKADMETRRQAGAGQQAQSDAAARRAVEEAAQRKAEAEMAALRQAEADATKKAETEAAAKKQADEALARAQAERQKADAEARHKADAEARQKAEADDKTRADAEARLKVETEAGKKAAEVAEAGLRLGDKDRQKIQIALTALGFNTGGSDGALGPRSRQMIAAWQQKAGAPATGFVSAAQRDELLRSAAPAIVRWEEEQKKAEEQTKLDEQKKADEAKTAAAAPKPTAPPPPPPPPPAAAAGAVTGTVVDGFYSGAMNSPIRMSGSQLGIIRLTLDVRNGRGSGTMDVTNNNGMVAQPGSVSISISPDGGVSGSGQVGSPTGATIKFSVAGRAEGTTIKLDFTGFRPAWKHGPVPGFQVGRARVSEGPVGVTARPRRPGAAARSATPPTSPRGKPSPRQR